MADHLAAIDNSRLSFIGWCWSSKLTGKSCRERSVFGNEKFEGNHGDKLRDNDQAERTED
jgi:hypothetical protein